MVAIEIESSPHQTPRMAGACPLDVTKPPPWHGWVAADLFLSELSSGLFLVAALGQLISRDAYGPVARIGFLLAFPVILADLVCLVADLGDPTRFHHMLRTFKPYSPMSIGVWGISFYALLSFTCFALIALSTVGVPVEGLPLSIAAAVGIVPAMFVGAYKGVLLSATAQPVWCRMRSLGAELSISSAKLGVAATLIIAFIRTQAPAAAGLRIAFIVLAAIDLAMTLLFAFEGGSEIAARIGTMRAASVYLVLIASTSIAPLVLAIAMTGNNILALAAALAITGTAAFRYFLVILPHTAFQT
jgi:Polysulphide reductase, NrfD